MVSPVPQQGPNPFLEGSRATYRATISGLVVVTGATDIFTLTAGAKIVRLERVEISGVIATPALNLDVLGIIRSTADLTGTSTTPAIAPLDSGDVAATAVVKAYTANPGTLGTAVGTVRSDKILLPVAPAQPDRLIWVFGDHPAKTVMLRAANYVFAVNLNGIAIATATSLDLAIEWTEDLS